MTKIVRPSTVKRALVALADLALFLFVALGVFAAGQAIANQTGTGSTLRHNIESYQLDSGLYYAGEDGEAKPYDNLASYELYQEKLVYFYTVYLVTKAPQGYQENYDVYWYNVNVLGLEDALGKYKGATVSEPGYSTGKTLFEYVLAGDSPQYDILGIPRAELHEDGDPNKPLTATAKSRLLSFFYDPAKRNCYYNAGQRLYYSEFYQKDLNAYQIVTSVAPAVVGIVFSGLVFYVLFPLIFKDGQTLCKKAFGLGVIGAGGYKAKKSQIVLRQLPAILLGGVLFAFISFRIAVMIASGVLLLSYILAIATKSNQALHDFLAFTIVVDEKESLFYANKEEEEQAGKAFQEAMDEADALLQEGEETIRQEQRDKSLK